MDSSVTLAPGQAEEREYLLRACFGLDALRARQYARQLSEGQFGNAFAEAVDRREELGFKPSKDSPRNFFGRYYSIREGRFRQESGWQEFRKRVVECLATDQGESVHGILGLLLDGGGTASYSAVKARFGQSREALDLMLGLGVIEKATKGEQTSYALIPGTVPLIREMQTDTSLQVGPSVWVKSELAKEELDNVEEMDQQFDRYLQEVIESRLDGVQEFGREFSVAKLAEYLIRLFGPELYIDTLLGLAHQYALSDVEVRNLEGGIAMQTGFNLALFGAPGTGKTFAVSDFLLGSPKRGVAAHGLPGRNRHCGGMTPAFFIRIGEAYQGRKFNFLVTEFNDWFKYKGMVEPLKLALDQQQIRWETKTESVGPYQFSSFFSTNYNTKVFQYGYSVTVSDPNFSAIEDRMVCRLHRMTRERYEQIAKSQRELALGQMQMDLAQHIRDHLVLVYAIQTEHPQVAQRFRKRPVELTSEAYDRVTQAREAVLAGLEDKHVPFSARLERRALQLASAMSLPSYFAQAGDRLRITDDALNYAIKFFVEEASVRSQERFDPKQVLAQLGLGAVDMAGPNSDPA